MIVSTLAQVNLLAILGFVAWLGGTQRLTHERAQAARLIFARTIDQEKVALDQSEHAATVARKSERH